METALDVQARGISPVHAVEADGRQLRGGQPAGVDAEAKSAAAEGEPVASVTS